MKRIYLIDCPGIVPASANDSDTNIALKGVIRISNLVTPSEHIPELLERVRTEYIERTYGVKAPAAGWKGQEGAEDLLTKIARKSGRLLKGGQADVETAAKMVLQDWIRGKIPFFIRPPENVFGTSKKASEQDQEDEVEQKKGPSVTQPIKKIVVMNSFIEEDRKPLDGIDVFGKDADATESADLDNADEAEAEEWHGIDASMAEEAVNMTWEQAIA